jgi:hypothetical protein
MSFEKPNWKFDLNSLKGFERLLVFYGLWVLDDDDDGRKWKKNWLDCYLFWL